MGAMGGEMGAMGGLSALADSGAGKLPLADTSIQQRQSTKQRPFEITRAVITARGHGIDALGSKAPDRALQVGWIGDQRIEHGCAFQEICENVVRQGTDAARRIEKWVSMGRLRRKR